MVRALLVLLLLILLFGSLGVLVAKAFLFAFLILLLASILSGGFYGRGRWY